MDSTSPTTTEYPVGSPCPVHGRVHNSHGWYVCLPDGGFVDEDGRHASAQS